MKIPAAGIPAPIASMPTPRHNGLPPTIWRLETEHWRLEGRNAASDELVGGSQGSERVLVIRGWPISAAARVGLAKRGIAFLVQACQVSGLAALVDRWQVIAGEGASQLAKEAQGQSDVPSCLGKRRRW